MTDHRRRRPRHPLPDLARACDGSDAMNPEPDYSAAYVVAERPTTASRATASRSPTAAATSCAWPRSTRSRTHVVGRDLDEITRRPRRGFCRDLTGDRAAALARAREGRHPHGHRRGRQRGVGPVGEAPRASRCGSCSSDMTPRAARRRRRLPLHHRRARPRSRRCELLRGSARRARPRARRRCARDGYPAYTTSTGWLGYSDEKVRRLCREAVAEGWTAFKMKVGRQPRGQRPARRAHARGDRRRTAG